MRGSAQWATMRTHRPVAATTSPLQKYHTMVEAGALRPDDHQTKIIQILQDLYNKLLEYSPPTLPIVTETKSFVRLHHGPAWPGSRLTAVPPSFHNYSLAPQNLKRKCNLLAVYTFMGTWGPARPCSWIYSTTPYPLL